MPATGCRQCHCQCRQQQQRRCHPRCHCRCWLWRHSFLLGQGIDVRCTPRAPDPAWQRQQKLLVFHRLSQPSPGQHMGQVQTAALELIGCLGCRHRHAGVFPGRRQWATHHMQLEAQVCQACKGEAADCQAEGSALRKAAHSQRQQPAQSKEGQRSKHRIWGRIGSRHTSIMQSSREKRATAGGRAVQRRRRLVGTARIQQVLAPCLSPLPAGGRCCQQHRPDQQRHQDAHCACRPRRSGGQARACAPIGYFRAPQTSRQGCTLGPASLLSEDHFCGSPKLLTSHRAGAHKQHCLLM